MTMLATCYGNVSQELFDKLKNIQLLVLDVDGTLTTGDIIYDNNALEYKKFNVKDGLGINKLISSNIQVAIITGRSSKIVEKRAQDLGIKYVYQGYSDKNIALTDLYDKSKISLNNVAYIGDDINDSGVFAKVGFSFAPNDAHPYIKKIANYVLSLNGGMGACREACDLILMSQGLCNLDGSFINKGDVLCQ